MRIAEDPRGVSDGTMRFWIRTPDSHGVTSLFVVLVADYIPEATHFNIGRRAGAISLDNVVRIVCLEPTEWMLCETQLLGIQSGLVHGRMHLFAQSGTLMAVAGQSAVVRLFDAESG